MMTKKWRSGACPLLAPEALAPSRVLAVRSIIRDPMDVACTAAMPSGMLSVARGGGQRVMATAFSAAARGVAAAMVVLVQHGCRPPPVVHEITFDRLDTLDSKPLVGQPVAVERLLVVADVEPRFFSEPMFDGFHDALTNRLAACGTRRRALPRIRDRLDAAAGFMRRPGEGTERPRGAVGLRIGCRQGGPAHRGDVDRAGQPSFHPE